jgi:hypothetical protein
MDRIDTKMVRPTVRIKDECAVWVGDLREVTLNLIWLERTAGTFGPASAAYASYLRLSVKKPIPISTIKCFGYPDDRGSSKAWIMYFKCPLCSRRCRVLYSRKHQTKFGCVKCNRPAYPSNCWGYTGRRNAQGISFIMREKLKYEQSAEKIKQNYAYHIENTATIEVGKHNQSTCKISKLKQKMMKEQAFLYEQKVRMLSMKIDIYKLQKLNLKVF